MSPLLMETLAEFWGLKNIFCKVYAICGEGALLPKRRIRI